MDALFWWVFGYLALYLIFGRAKSIRLGPLRFDYTSPEDRERERNGGGELPPPPARRGGEKLLGGGRGRKRR